MNRRMAILLCLLLSAALLCALPTVITVVRGADGARMAQRLRPAEARTLTVWLIGDAAGGRKHLLTQIGEFEKKNSGVRVFLRNADALELTAKDAVLPDAVLFTAGTIVAPEAALLPLGESLPLHADALAAGRSAEIQYAAPLWFSPNILAVDRSEKKANSPKSGSLFELGTPLPQKDTEPGEEKPEIPWGELSALGLKEPPVGVAWQQLLAMCPQARKTELIARLYVTPGSTQKPSPTPTGQQPAAKTGPETSPKARVMSLQSFQAAGDENTVGYPMVPAVSDHVAFLGLCRNHELSRAFLWHLLSTESQKGLYAYGLMPVAQGVEAPQGASVAAEVAAAFQNGLLFPNAFEYTKQERESLCADAFARGADPVETLLRLQ